MRLCGIHAVTWILYDFSKYCDTAEARWKFIHTESKGFALLLFPSHVDSNYMVGTDRIDTITQLRKYTTKISGTESGDKFNQELNGFLTMFTLLDTKTKKLCEQVPLRCWQVYGRIEIAIPIYNTHVLSAASEKAWSSFDFIHTKRRNKLLN